MSEEQKILDRYERRKVAAEQQAWFGYTGPMHLLRIQERHGAMLQALAASGRRDLSQFEVLDIGCGNGNILRRFVDWGGTPERMHGVELRPDAVEEAVYRNAQIDVRVGSATELPWDDQSFDLVLLNTVFSSILDADMRVRIVGEICRVLRDGGAVIWYDFFLNNPSNPDVTGVNRAEIEKLFEGFDIRLRKITLAPPIARRLPRWCLKIGYPLLAAFPFLRTHYLGVFERPARDSG